MISKESKSLYRFLSRLAVGTLAVAVLTSAPVAGQSTIKVDGTDHADRD
jgi:hypothetical protein